MKHLYLVPVAFCLLTVFFSCKPKTDYSKEISSLDSAVVKLKDAEKLFLSLDTNSLHASSQFFHEKLDLIREKVQRDTIQKTKAQFLSEAYEQEGNLSNLLDNKRFLGRAIMEGQQRINDLKHDLAANLIDKNKADEYVVTEVRATGKICDAVNKSIQKGVSGAAKLDSLKTQIVFWADSLQSK